MNSLPTLSQADYEQVAQHNLMQFEKLLAGIDPTLYLIYQYIKHTEVNPKILPKVLRGISNIARSRSKKGRIIIFVEGNTMQIQIREDDEGSELVFNEEQT